MPLSSLNVDEYNVAGGCSLLLLRRLAMAKAAGGALEDAFKSWMADYRRDVDPDLVDLAIFETVASDAARASSHQTCRLFNLSFSYELPLYKALLQPALEAIPASHSNSPEVRRYSPLLTVTNRTRPRFVARAYHSPPLTTPHHWAVSSHSRNG